MLGSDLLLEPSDLGEARFREGPTGDQQLGPDLALRMRHPAGARSARPKTPTPQPLELSGEDRPLDRAQHPPEDTGTASPRPQDVDDLRYGFSGSHGSYRCSGLIELSSPIRRRKRRIPTFLTPAKEAVGRIRYVSYAEPRMRSAWRPRQNSQGRPPALIGADT